MRYLVAFCRNLQASRRTLCRQQIWRNLSARSAKFRPPKTSKRSESVALPLKSYTRHNIR
eukprot:4308180-Pleurochrysis_carterae.AAC.1